MELIFELHKVTYARSIMLQVVKTSVASETVLLRLTWASGKEQVEFTKKKTK